MTTVNDLSESEIIEILQENLPQDPKISVSIGDDAAVMSVPSGELVTSTDMMIEDVDFRLSWEVNSGYSQGWKAFVQNAADIYAMGAKPTAMLLTLGLPQDTEVEYIQGIAKGIAECARDEYGLADFAVIGGDLASSDKVIISVTMFGELVGAKPVTRSGAKPGDVVLVSGIPGKAAIGLDMLEGKLEPVEESPFNPDFRKLQLMPSPPIDAAPDYIEIASAMIDTSDGLVKDLERIAKASDVHIDIKADFFDELFDFYDFLGLDKAVVMEYMLQGGEDHNMVIVVPRDKVPEQSVEDCLVLGTVEAGSGVYFEGKPVEENGWDHFDQK